MTKRKDTEKIRLCQKIGDSYASVDDGEGIIFVNTRHIFWIGTIL